MTRASLAPALCRGMRHGLVPPAAAAVQRRFLNLHEYQAGSWWLMMDDGDALALGPKKKRDDTWWKQYWLMSFGWFLKMQACQILAIEQGNHFFLTAFLKLQTPPFLAVERWYPQERRALLPGPADLSEAPWLIHQLPQLHQPQARMWALESSNGQILKKKRQPRIKLKSMSRSKYEMIWNNHRHFSRIEWASAQVPPTPLYLGGTVGRERERQRGRGRGRDGWMDG